MGFPGSGSPGGGEGSDVGAAQEGDLFGLAVVLPHDLTVQALGLVLVLFARRGGNSPVTLGAFPKPLAQESQDGLVAIAFRYGRYGRGAYDAGHQGGGGEYGPFQIGSHIPNLGFPRLRVRE